MTVGGGSQCRWELDDWSVLATRRVDIGAGVSGVSCVSSIARLTGLIDGMLDSALNEWDSQGAAGGQELRASEGV